MILSLENQASIFFVTIMIGFIIGLVYDFFRLLRKLFIHKNALVYIEDTLFWLMSTFLCFYILLHNNNLEFRFYLIVGIFLGLIFYFSLISRYILKLFIRLIEVILKPIAIILKIISPFAKKLNIKRNKAIYREKIILQKFLRYGKMKHKDFKSTIKIILNKI